MARKMTLKGNQDNGQTRSDQEQSSSVPYRFDLNLIELVRVIFDKRRLVIGVTVSVMVITAIYLFLQPNRFTSTATILPSGKIDNFTTLKSLVGLGGSFGNPDENSSMLYPVILRSNLVVDAVLDREYTFKDDSQNRTINLKDYFGIENRDRLRQALRDITKIRSDNQTGEIYVGVETIYPELSQSILEQYLDRLEDYNINKRRSSARDKEKYLAGQLDMIESQLRASEDSLEAFQKANLDWAVTSSPEILKDLGRLRREMESRAATYNVIMQEYEMAKIEAQKDIPIVRILDQPSLPTFKSGPFRRNMILMSGFIAFILISLVLIIRHLAGQMTSGENHDDFLALRRDFQTVLPRTRHTLNRVKDVIRDKVPLPRV